MLLQNSNITFNQNAFGKSRCDMWGRTDRIGEASNRLLELFSEATHKRVSNSYTRLNLKTHKKRNTYMLDCIVTTDTIPLFD